MKAIQRVILLFILSAAVSGCASTAKPDQDNEEAKNFGLSIATAIEVCKPKGQRQYLSTLVCADGQPPKFHRVGNFGARTPLVIPENMTPEQEKEFIANLPYCGASIQAGETDYHIVDGYEVQCSDQTTMIYMDMYHCNQAEPTQVPAGFTRAP